MVRGRCRQVLNWPQSSTLNRKQPLFSVGAAGSRPLSGKAESLNNECIHLYEIEWYRVRIALRLYSEKLETQGFLFISIEIMDKPFCQRKRHYE